MKTSPTLLLLGGFATLAIGICAAQNFGGGRGFGGGRWHPVENVGPVVETEGRPPVLVNEDTVRTARETARHGKADLPDWTNTPGFERDVFTFTRIIYKFGRYGEDPRISRTASQWGWITDYPDSDLNLSYRLQQLTAFKVDPDGRVLRLTDPALREYPFIYMVEAGRMELTDEEIPILRKYLLNGGVLMADDFWGLETMGQFWLGLKKVLPERQWVELPMDHPSFIASSTSKVPQASCKPRTTAGSRQP